MIMNIPNMLTSFRFVLIPVFVFIFFSSLSNSLIISMVIFLIAGFTDILDGYIARKYNMITKCGSALDPLADKIMLLTVLSCLVLSSYFPIWVIIVVATKDIFMIITGILLYKRDSVIQASIWGKLCTFLFYISIFIVPFDRQFAFIMLCISVISAILALYDYAIIYFKSKK